jgi:hypothetical protein
MIFAEHYVYEFHPSLSFAIVASLVLAGAGWLVIRVAARPRK